MVTAVIGHIIGITLALMSYYTCVVFATLLSPWTADGRAICIPA